VIRSLLVLIAAIPLGVSAQDTTRTLFFNDFVKLVSQFHPLAKSAALRKDQAGAAVLMRRGAFDPNLTGTYSEKDFDGKDYYALTNSYVNWQSPFAVQIKAGYEHNSGIYVNDESRTPDGGLWFAGASLPLLQGLLFDEARGNAALAGIGMEALDNERKALVNTLIYQASLSYWDWFEDYADYAIDVEGLQLAQDRFQFIRSVHSSGDRPAIDTLEAFIQVQQRQLTLAERLIGLKKSAAMMENWLLPVDQNTWKLPTGREYSPEIDRALVASAEIPEMAREEISNHPELKAYTFKESMLKVERRIKNEKIKPKLNVEYTFMNAEPAGIPMEGQQAGRKLGLDFKMPLFLRAERGDLALNRIKLRDNSFLSTSKKLELGAKFDAFMNEVQQLSGQITTYRTVVENQRLMLQAERTRFENGESSVFLVNLRESSYLEARRKLNQLVGKYYKARAGLDWTVARIP
jgi:outer membrane protein TolC